MKKTLVVLALLSIAGSASAWGLADIGNLETFDYPDGNLRDVSDWATWGGTGGLGDVVVSDGICTITTNSYEYIFSHDNALADIGGPVPGVDVVELHFDVISGDATPALIQLQYFDADNSFPNANTGAGDIRRDSWNSFDLSTPGHYVFTSLSPIPLDTVAITPLIGLNGPGSGSITIDNVQLIPEPTTLLLLGLGGLLIRKR